MTIAGRLQRDALRIRADRRRRRAGLAVPPDPRSVVDGPLDGDLGSIRAHLVDHRRRLWVRRIVRRFWLAAAAALLLEIALLVIARLAPIELLPSLLIVVAVAAAGTFLVMVARCRPSIGETAMAVDAEGRLGDRVTSALALASGLPLDGALQGGGSSAGARDDSSFEAAAAEQFVRRQRSDAARALAAAPAGLFRPRFSRRPAAFALGAILLIVPLAVLPNSQDQSIAIARATRDEAQKQATKLDEIAKDLESRGQKRDDPRSRLAADLHDLAAQLRNRPGDLVANLARLGSVEAAVTSQLDPSNEQRASALTSLNRALSRAASGSPTANPQGDPKTMAEDLKRLGDRLATMTPQERAAMAAALSSLQSAASQASATAAQSLRDAAAATAAGNATAAQEALQRLADALGSATQQVQTNRDLAGAASRLQEARRALANAGRQGQPNGQNAQGQAQPGSSGQPGQGQGQGQPGSSGQPGQGQGQGQPGASGHGQGQGQGQGQAGGSGQPGQGQGQGQGQAGGSGQGQGQPGASGQGGQGQGQGQGQSQGQSQGQGQVQGQAGQVGGGGSSARSLGQAAGGNRVPGAPTGANRAATLGDALSSVFADFQRLGKPGDPSYVAGTGGDGQTQQGNQTGQGQNNGALTPYQQVFADFYRYALTSLDRNYVPLSVKDYVRDYFSSLDPRSDPTP